MWSDRRTNLGDEVQAAAAGWRQSSATARPRARYERPSYPPLVMEAARLHEELRARAFVLSQRPECSREFDRALRLKDKARARFARRFERLVMGKR